MTVVILALAGSIGAVARYVVSGAVQERSRSSMPAGTAAVNVLGAFLLGVIVGTGNAESTWWSAAAGVMGGFTTFSTWMVETARLGVVPRFTARAAVNLLVMALLGVACAALGYYLTQ